MMLNRGNTEFSQSSETTKQCVIGHDVVILSNYNVDHTIAISTV